jgi:glycosyltransferase involved in cell wall biosynthesis
MKVLFNTYPVAFDCPGGGEIQLLKTKEALESLGSEVVLFDAWSPIPSDVDVVHYFSVQGGSINFCSYVKDKGLPLVISPIIWLGRDKDKYPLGEIGELLRISDAIFPNSISEQKLLAEFFAVDESKFHMTYNAIDREFATDSPSDEFRTEFQIDGPFILNVANIEERKNQLSLVRAVKGMDLQLVLVGNIRDKVLFDACMNEGKDFVRYVSYIPHEHPLLKSAYDTCDLFVLPSLLETPGLSALEAAARGKKLVITEIGAMGEYFGDFVTYVDPYSVHSIREGIERELKTHRDGSLRHHVAANFTWQHTAQQTLEGYGKAIRGRGRSD